LNEEIARFLFRTSSAVESSFAYSASTTKNGSFEGLSGLADLQIYKKSKRLSPLQQLPANNREFQKHVQR